MKEKLKLLILKIEGWRESTTIKNHFKHNSRIEEGTMLFYAFTLEEAWEEQFNKISDLLQTKLFWLAACCILVIVFGIFSTHSTIIKNGYLWCDYAMFAALIYPIVLTFIMIGYAVKNSYLAIRKWRKEKKDDK
jgi:hypothetical protein